MEAARGVQRYISGKRKAHEIESKRKAILRYVEQLSGDLASLSDSKAKDSLRQKLLKLVEEKYAILEAEGKRRRKTRRK